MRTFFVTLVMLFGLSSAFAQSGTSKVPAQDGALPPNEPLWIGNFASGQFVINLNKVVCIAKQSYVLDATLFVREVTIDTSGGSSQIRIYCIEPLTEKASNNALDIINDRAKGLGKNASAKVAEGVNPETVVTKSYPTTTHAHTIEFRVATPQEIDLCYTSILNAYKSGKGRVFTAAK